MHVCIFNPNQNTPGVIKVVANNLKMTMVKRCKIKRGPRSLAVDGIKIFDDDDHTTKYYCCLTLTSSGWQATMSVCHFAEWMEPVWNILQDAKNNV